MPPHAANFISFPTVASHYLIRGLPRQETKICVIFKPPCSDDGKSCDFLGPFNTHKKQQFTTITYRGEVLHQIKCPAL